MAQVSPHAVGQRDELDDEQQADGDLEPVVRDLVLAAEQGAVAESREHIGNKGHECAAQRGRGDVADAHQDCDRRELERGEQPERLRAD